MALVDPWRRITQDSSTEGLIDVAIIPPFDPSGQPWEVATDFQQRVTPPQRYMTLPSFAQPFFPSLAPAQSINLINQGINHRLIGTCTLTGGAQGLQVFISGTNRSSTFAALSCRMTRQLGTTGQATAVFNVPSGGFVPELGALISIIENNNVLFSGLIIKRSYTVYPATTMTKYTATAVDWTGLLQRHIIAADYDADTLISIMNRIMTQPTIAADFISTAGVDTSLSVADAFSFSYIKISDAVGQLAVATNTVWWVNNQKILQMILIANAVPSAFSVTESGDQVDPEVTVEDSLDNYRNTQYVRASGQLLSETITVTDSHTFSGSVTDIVCITRYPFISAPQSVLENGIEIVGTNRFFKLNVSGPSNYPPGGEGWYWMDGSYGVWHWPSTGIGLAGTTLDVTYTGISTFAGNVVKYIDSGQVLAQQAISGGSGVFEEIEDYSGLLTYNQALALAQGIEQSTAPPPQSIKVSTIEFVEDVGYAVSVNLPRWNINDTYIIQKIDRVDMGSDLGKGTRFRTTLQLVSTRTLGNYPQYWERLYARLNKAQVVAPTEKPTWDLAADQPGSPSSGLSIGSFGSPYDVKVGLGRIAYVTYVQATAADQDVIINVFLNGNTIFSTSTLLTYTPSDTGSTVIYVNLNPDRVNVVRGDLITWSILQCGSVTPGKNGTLSVVIAER